MNLSKHFTLDEFCHSAMAARMGKVVIVPGMLIPRLRDLCENVLEPLRVGLRKPVVILSGYRPPWLNSAVGGSRASQHMKGEAVDILVPGMKPIQVCQKVIDLGLPFDQIILEFDQWTHLSYRPEPRGSVLTAVKQDGRTRYLPGLLP